jgi:(p)ppGpp synthase/HD superfamily hydrolase
MSTWNPDLVEQAWRLAAEAHHGQCFPDTELPYLLHLGQVTMELMAALATEPVDQPDLAVQCAILHDVVEDTGYPRERLAECFGPAVAAGVEALTKNSSLPKERQMADSLARIVAQPREVGMVKLADRITNLQPAPPSWTRERAAAYLEEARLILRHLAPCSPCLAGRLAERIRLREAAI